MSRIWGSVRFHNPIQIIKKSRVAYYPICLLYLKERSHTSAHGRIADGSLHALMSWHATTANTQETSRSGAKCVTVPSLAQTTFPSIWNATQCQISMRPQSGRAASRASVHLSACGHLLPGKLYVVVCQCLGTLTSVQNGVMLIKWKFWNDYNIHEPYFCWTI